MTTEQKIAHVRWYIEQRNASCSVEMRQLYKDQGMGAAGAWFADMTLGHEDYNTLKEELQKEMTSD